MLWDGEPLSHSLHTTMQARKLTTGLILAFWVALIGVTYWRMELRFLTPASRPAGAAEIDPTQQPPAPVQRLQTDAGARALHSKITLLNFWSPDCACSRFMEPHVRDLVERFQPQGVQWITVILVDDARATDSEILHQWRTRGIETPALVDRGGLLARQFGVWAGPAAVIVDARGRIVYTGAYNIGRYCDNERTAYAQQALEAVLTGRTPPRAKTPFYGCRLPQ
jgi:hypothetical protein